MGQLVDSEVALLAVGFPACAALERLLARVAVPVHHELHVLVEGFAALGAVEGPLVQDQGAQSSSLSETLVWLQIPPQTLVVTNPNR